MPAKPTFVLGFKRPAHDVLLAFCQYDGIETLPKLGDLTVSTIRYIEATYL